MSVWRERERERERDLNSTCRYLNEADRIWKFWKLSHFPYLNDFLWLQFECLCNELYVAWNGRKVSEEFIYQIFIELKWDITMRIHAQEQL